MSEEQPITTVLTTPDAEAAEVIVSLKILTDVLL
jgi:hypothetical protein